MRREFDFRNARVKLKIAGHVFEVDMGRQALHETLADFSRRALEYSKALKTSKDAKKTLEEATQFILTSIDGILGQGASERIFQDRTAELADAADVVNYILQGLNQAREKRMQRYQRLAEAGQ